MHIYCQYFSRSCLSCTECNGLLQLAPDVSITLPPEVFHRDIASDRLKFIYFRSSKLFVGARSATSSVDDVITASVGPEVAFDLPNCVTFVIPNRQVRQPCTTAETDERYAMTNS